MTAELVQHRYHPVGAAEELFHCREPEVLLSGPAGTGKSRACLEKMHFCMLATPGARGLIVRKTATSLASTAMVTFQEYVAKEAIASGEVHYFGGSGKEPAQFVYGNGSTINIGGLDKVSRIMSSEYDLIFCQESTELSEDDWESLTTRLRNGRISFQQLMADTNPGPPHHWLKRRCERGQTVMFYSKWEDNPRLFDKGVWTREGATYTRLLKNLTGVRKQRLAYGKWAAAEGLVYEGFDPAVHLWKPIFRPPNEWPRYWGVDFGFTNAFVWQDWAADRDGRLFLIQEIYRTQTLVEDHAKEILRLAHKSEFKGQPEFVVCDHDAEGRATLERELGISTVAAHKSVLEGIEAVQARMKLRDDGRPGMYITRDACRNKDQALVDVSQPASTEEEVTEYIWADPGLKHEQPVKKNDHGCDAMRYVVAQVDLVGRPRLRFLRLWTLYRMPTT